MYVNQSGRHNHSPRIEHLGRFRFRDVCRDASNPALANGNVCIRREALRWIDDTAAAYQKIVSGRAASLRIQQTLRSRREAADERRQEN